MRVLAIAERPQSRAPKAERIAPLPTLGALTRGTAVAPNCAVGNCKRSKPLGLGGVKGAAVLPNLALFKAC